MSREKRPCWKCGKPGHISAQCTSGAAKLLDHASPAGATFSLQYEDEEDGFVMAKRTARPQKVPVTIASFLDVNSFKPLEGQNERKRREKEKKVAFCEDFRTGSETALINDQSSFCILNCACRKPVSVGVVAQGRSGGTEAVGCGGQSKCHQSGPEILSSKEMLAIAEHLYGGTQETNV